MIDLLSHGAHRAGFALLVLFVLLPVTSSAQESGSPQIAVLVINPRSGKPLKNAFVLMATWNGKADEDTPATSVARTNAAGRAIFRVATPTPRHVSFTLSPRDHEFCSPGIFSTKDVLRTGIIDKYDPTCGKLKWTGRASPGNVVIFVRKLNVWQQMLTEIP